MGGALFGQGLNFLAMLLPIVGGETGQLAYLMLPLALATVLSRTSILGFHSRYLTVPGERTRTATAVSAASLSVTTLLCLLVGAAVAPVRDVALWTGLLVVTNGLYLMAVAVATREQRIDVYSTARLAFGITNIIITSLVVFVVPFQAGLIVAAAANPLVGTVLILTRTQNRILPPTVSDLPRMLDREHRFYLAGSGRATGGVLLAEVGFQFQGFITPFLGQYQEIWAVVVRLTGGFGTLVQQIIAPPCEAKLAGCIRAADSEGTRAWFRKIILIGAVLGVGSAAVQTAAILLFLPDDDAVTAGSLVAVSVFCLFWMPSAMCGKIPLMKGLTRPYLAWSVTRLVFLLPLLLLRDGNLFVAVIAVMSVTSVIIIWISARPATVNQ